MWASGGNWFVLTSSYYICCIGSLITYSLETFTIYTWQRDDGPNIQTVTESDAEKHSFFSLSLSVGLV